MPLRQSLDGTEPAGRRIRGDASEDASIRVQSWLVLIDEASFEAEATHLSR